jgi:hypothetical protein
MQTRSEAEEAEQLARQLRAVREAVQRSQELPNANSQLRQELKSQLAALEAQREEIAGQLTNPMVSGSNRAGLSRRIENLDNRIEALDQQIAQVEAAIAGAPRAISVVPPRMPRNAPDRPAPGIVLGGMFMLCVLLPLSIAYARRIWRRGAAVVTSIPAEINERLSRMDQNLDTIAVEVERIGEGQRFLTRVYAEQLQGLPRGQAERVETPDREKVGQRRSP